MSFGDVISEKRKKLGLSQKEVAEKIKKEDGEPISPQYLNDLEHDRRNPPAPFILKQIATLLGLDVDYLHTLAGEFPPDIKRERISEEESRSAWQAFRKKLDSK